METISAVTRSSVCFVFGLAMALALAQDPTPADVKMFDTLGGQGGGGFGRGVGQVTLSPDGAVVGWVGPSLDKSVSNGIWLMPVAGGAARQVKAVGQERDMAWSPDGSSIAMLSGERGEEPQIYISPANGGEARKLTNFTGQIRQPEWSPDGKSIAFLAIENPSRASGATQPFKPQTGVVGTKADVQRVAIVDVATAQQHWASPADMYVYEFGWSPDSRQLAVTAALPPGENNWWTAKLYAADAASGQLRLVATPELQLNRPRWSPDGQSIAYVGGLMSDFGSVGGDVWLAPAAGGQPRNLTKGLKGTATSISWTKEGSIVFGEIVEGETAFQMLDPRTGRITLLDKEAASFSGPNGRDTAAVSADEKTEAYAKATLTHGSEIFAGPAGHPNQLTHWEDDAVPTWGPVQSVHWKSGKFDVQGWLVAPAHLEPGKKYPMIVQVHGGPAGAYTGSWSTGQGASFWSRAGYFVFMPNPRGSFGEGEEFTRANRKDFGYGDLKDILGGVDEVLRTQPVDRNRLGITGGSYGGYMSMWAVTQTHRFKASVAVAGIANWQSYYGENSIDEWMIPYFGASVYDDPKVYAKSSPIEFIKNVKTPTLVAVGEYDGECPPPQSYEFWHALNVLGVKTELLVYPGEGHGIRQPENRRDLNLREFAWFNHYLK